MLLKHVHMGWKFQRTLKLDISFSLEHFFISVAIFPQVASASLREAWKIPKKLPKLKTQLSWKAKYSFLQFSSKESLMFCRTCLKLEDKMKSSNNYNPSFGKVCSNFWKRAIVEHAKIKMHSKACEFQDMEEAQKLEKKYKKKKTSTANATIGESL